MKKTILYIVLAMLCLIFEVKAQSQPILLTGQLSDPEGKAIPNATLKIIGEKTTALSNKEGKFIIKSTRLTGKLIVRHIGYETVELDFNRKSLKPFNIILKEDNSQLKEVVVVSTGYQIIPKERATGSFVLIDSALLNRKVSTNILDRLDGVTSGLIFNKNQQYGSQNSAISIRGRSTIFANPEPLIILDNFPYEDDINNINPNDIENITILKDAAAASIWGVKAGNGVIVITSKKGKVNQSPSVTLNTNLTIGEKPNLFRQPQLNSSEFIDFEEFLFNKGAYNSAINTGFTIISPAVEIFLQRRNRSISSVDSAKYINALKDQDVRHDIQNHLTRNLMNQQYQLNMSGSGKSNQYYISTGYDDSRANSVANSSNRLTLNVRNTYLFFKDKLELTSSLQLTNSHFNVNLDNYTPLSPYERIADAQGNPLPTTKGIRMLYADTAGKGRLLDWHYYPINDNVPTNTSGTLDYRLSTDISYSILNSLKATAYYLYQKGMTDFVKTQTENSFFTRNIINSFSQINQTTGVVSSVIPIGDILDKSNSTYRSNIGRFQLNYKEQFGQDHELNALAGFEISEYASFSDAFRLYGYDQLTARNGNQSIDYKKENPQYFGGTNVRISNGSTSNGTIDRSRSYYWNASYLYKRQYAFSASARWDESNLFGVSANQKGVPLWSAGLSWDISQAKFYRINWLPYLKLRATYGYNGNTDKSTSAYLTSSASAISVFNNPTLVITNPPNPLLRWEKVEVANIGLDFNLFKQIFSGSVDYFVKRGTDLIANSPIAPQSGINEFTGNSADMITRGIDFTLKARIISRSLKWDASLLFNYAKDKIINYKVKPGSNQSIVSGNYSNPLEGYSFYSLFSLPYAGLDSLGNPRGYLNGEISNTYTNILNSTDRTNLRYSGVANPIYFGSVLNSISYHNFNISMNVLYKLGYSFQRKSLNYTTLLRGDYKQSDYQLRWQQKGDEHTTTVPSLVYPSNTNRNTFYQSSDVLVERGDHIRLQDIRFGYDVNKNQFRGLPFKTIQLFLYASNLGILWRSNGLGLDPDSPNTIPIGKSFSIGLKAIL